MPYRDPDYQKKYFQEYYKLNKEKKIAQAVVDRRRFNLRNAEYVNERKRNPCMDCKGSFPPICMDFDHVRGEKINHVSVLVKRGSSLKRLQDEMDKCDLVCANCHRIRTQDRMKSTKQE